MRNAFKKDSTPQQRYQDASAICKEHFTPVDRWVVVTDTNTDTLCLLGIIKPESAEKSSLNMIIDQLDEVIIPLGGRIEIAGECRNIGAISNDPGFRQNIVILDLDPTVVIEELASAVWHKNPYSQNTHTIIEDILNKSRLMAFYPKPLNDGNKPSYDHS